MDVAAVRGRIVELSHHGLGNDGEIETKALAWLNSAYHDVMGEVIGHRPARLQVREDVTSNSGGVASVSQEIGTLLKVVDRAANVVLAPVTPEELLDAEVAGSVTGPPKRCYFSGDEVVVHPARVTNLSVLYIPRVVDLAADGNEASILIPPEHHHVLVWGGLVWSALFERGFLSGSELALYQRQWEAGKAAIRLAMAGQVMRTKPFGWV